MRKIHKTFLCLALIIGLCACGQKAPTWQEQYDLGMRYLSEGNYEEAIIAFTAAIEIDPKRASAYVGRGNAYVLSDEAEDNLSAAKSDYEKAIELDEMMAEAYIGLADVYMRQGDYDKALEILRQGLEKNEKDQKISDKITEMEAKLTDEQGSNLYQGIVYLTREDRVKIIHEKYNLFNDQLLGGYADYDGDGYDESEFFDTYKVYTEDGWKTMASSFYYCDHDGKFAECLANFSYATNNLNVAGSSACFNKAGSADYLYCYVGSSIDEDNWMLYHLGVFAFSEDGFPKLIYENQDIGLVLADTATEHDEIEQYIEKILSFH